MQHIGKCLARDCLAAQLFDSCPKFNLDKTAATPAGWRGRICLCGCRLVDHVNPDAMDAVDLILYRPPPPSSRMAHPGAHHPESSAVPKEPAVDQAFDESTRRTRQSTFSQPSASFSFSDSTAVHPRSASDRSTSRSTASGARTASRGGASRPAKQKELGIRELNKVA
jgi:hypothetical protein